MGDESVVSEASTNYEELTEPDIITQPVVGAPGWPTAEDACVDIEHASEYVTSEDEFDVESACEEKLVSVIAIGDVTPTVITHKYHHLSAQI